MRARLKGLSSEAIEDLAHWRPPDPESFAVPLVLEVGPLGLRGRERFDLLVVTPGWLAERHGRAGAVFGASKLLVFEWDLARIKAFLAREVERCTGATWPEVARKVSRLAEWEGEGDEVVGLR
ncbi:MAG TPA: immunity 8 family protein [Anaeromyxobacteraceae bacterium]|nr:immunity 8 family protein [Anaeromyxobacteraceae bacterium]